VREARTLGIVLFTKTPQAASHLFANWDTTRIQKTYCALAQNTAQHDAYEIQVPIGLVPHPRLGSVWAANPRGKPSKSLARVTLTQRKHRNKRGNRDIGGKPAFGPPSSNQNSSSLQWEFPGWRSSIRLSGAASENLPGIPGDGGYFLHAQFLKFPHPITGVEINLEAALPSGFSFHL